MNYVCAATATSIRGASIPSFRGFPTIILIDPHGRVRLMMSGYHPPGGDRDSHPPSPRYSHARIAFVTYRSHNPIRHCD